jgi:hypothetical protein
MQAPDLQSFPGDGLVPHERSSIVAGSLWMIGLTLALFFLPLINGVIGGFVGGYKVSGVGRALAAAVLPAIVVAVGLAILFAILDAPVWGIVAGLSGSALVALADVGIFLGAAIGGAMGRAAMPGRRRAG